MILILVWIGAVVAAFLPSRVHMGGTMIMPGRFAGAPGSAQPTWSLESDVDPSLVVDDSTLVVCRQTMRMGWIEPLYVQYELKVLSQRWHPDQVRQSLANVPELQDAGGYTQLQAIAMMAKDGTNSMRLVLWRGVWAQSILLLASLGLLIGVLVELKRGARSLEAHRRRRRGCCPGCGYARTGLKESACCPECGLSPV